MSDDTRCDRCGKPWLRAGKGKFSIATPKTHWCYPCCLERKVIEAARAVSQARRVGMAGTDVYEKLIAQQDEAVEALDAIEEGSEG